MIEVPKHYRPERYPLYPLDNSPDFEHYLFQHGDEFNGITEREYLPVCWTAYYAMQRPYGRDQLNRWLQKLDKRKRYWTVVQYDDGIISDITGLDLLVFGMSGKNNDYPIPLLCQPHTYKPMVDAMRYTAAFVGAVTHPLRKKMMDVVASRDDYYTNTRRLTHSKFMNLLYNSTYALCPRGYGYTSFRICEALHAGAVPVYISDVFVEPYRINFNEYGIKITPRQLPDLPEILKKESVNIHALRLRGRELLPMFTFEGCKTEIKKILCNEYERPVQV